MPIMRPIVAAESVTALGPAVRGAVRGMPAAVVAAASARIGDARSMWDTGRLSVVNAVAAGQGITAGIAVRAAVARLRLV